jgi:hypothetical protein
MSGHVAFIAHENFSRLEQFHSVKITSPYYDSLRKFSRILEDFLNPKKYSQDAIKNNLFTKFLTLFQLFRQVSFT